MTPLAQAIQRSGKKQSELARHLGVERQYIDRWKRGKGAKYGADLPREHAQKAADFLNTNAAFLLGVSDVIERDDRSDAEQFEEIVLKLQGLGLMKQAIATLRDVLAKAENGPKPPTADPR